MKKLRYEVVDVFTDRPYAGNPLAVVLDADTLDGSQMQAIAREFNLSETTFALPPTGHADYRVRIFTVSQELPFAGHPSIGTAVTLARLGVVAEGDLVQECGAGMLPVMVHSNRARLTGGTPHAGDPYDPQVLLRAVNLTADDFVGPAPRTAGCGINFHYLSVTPEAVARAAPDATAVRDLGETGVCVFSWDAQRRTAHARVFFEAVGVIEDPATGSAALGLGVWLAVLGLLSEGTTKFTVRQGSEIRRPSTLDCSVTTRPDQVIRATVTGGVVPVGSGEIAVPPFIG